MNVDEGFDQLQTEVDVPPDVMKEARRRRDLFRSALLLADDVVEVISSGSLARGTHKDPLHDVDLIAVFDPEDHEGWGKPGTSAEESMDHLADLITGFLGPGGLEGYEVRLVRKQNHALKCFMDDPDDERPFTVDVAPALRHPERGFWIPELKSASWIRTDPEFLIETVAGRHSSWNQFAKLVRVLKRWSEDRDTGMKSLVVEVLALDHLPADARPDALSKFFAGASVAVMEPVVDPAGLCGEIQPDLDRSTARAALEEAAGIAWRAVDAAGHGDDERAMCLWREIFGDIFPEPPGGCAKAKGAPALIGAAAARPKRRVVDAPQG